MNKKQYLVGALSLSLMGCFGAGTKVAELDPMATVKPQVVTTGRYVKKPTPDIIGDTRAFKDITRVSVPFFRVQFNKRAGESASANTGGPLAPGAGTKVTIVAHLEGVDDQTMQAITDAAYADFIQQLTSAGYTLDTDAVNTSKKYQKLDSTDYPDTGSKKSVFMGKGMRNPGGKHTMALNIAKVAKEANTTVIMPDYVVDFASLGTDSSSEVNLATASVSLGQVAHVWGAIHGPGRAELGQAAYSTLSMGAFTDTTSKTAKGASTALNVLAGLTGGSTSSFSEKTLNTTPEKYQAATLDALRKANAALISKMKSASK